jgi:hypothetical protein
MQCPACQYRFTFCDSLKVLSPYHCVCPSCKARLSLGKQADRFVVVAMFAGAATAAVGIYLEQSHIFTSAQAFATAAGLFVVGGAFGEWYFWKHGVLSEKSPTSK